MMLYTSAEQANCELKQLDSYYPARKHGQTYREFYTELLRLKMYEVRQGSHTRSAKMLSSISSI